MTVEGEQPGKIISADHEHLTWAGFGQGTSGVVNRVTGEAMIEIMTPPLTLYGRCR